MGAAVQVRGGCGRTSAAATDIRGAIPLFDEPISGRCIDPQIIMGGAGYSIPGIGRRSICDRSGR